MRLFLFLRRMVGQVVVLSWMVAVGCAAEVAVAVKPAQTLTVVADRADALYRRGETVTFTVKLEVEGKPAAEGEVQWTLSQDGVEPKRSGQAKLVEGRATVTGTLDAPGFLQCRATWQGGKRN